MGGGLRQARQGQGLTECQGKGKTAAAKGGRACIHATSRNHNNIEQCMRNQSGPLSRKLELACTAGLLVLPMPPMLIRLPPGVDTSSTSPLRTQKAGRQREVPG